MFSKLIMKTELQYEQIWLYSCIIRRIQNMVFYSFMNNLSQKRTP